MASDASAQARVPDLVVEARLTRVSGPAPDCGHFHVVVVMEYEVLRVVRGSLSGRRIYVAHGCPELPRSAYMAGSGTLTAFRVGDVHRLELSRTPPRGQGPSVFDTLGSPPQLRYWALRVDPAHP